MKTVNMSEDALGNVFNVPIITLDNTSSPSFVYMLAGRSSDKVAVLIKISAADGSVSWARQISGSSSFSWDGVAVSSGNIFIVGNQSEPGVGGLLWVRSYDANGNINSTQNYIDGGNTLEAIGCAPAASGGLYIFGARGSSLNGMWMQVGSNLSSPIWQNFMSGMDARDTVNGLVTDSSNNLYWTAQFISGGEQYARVGKLNSSGAHQWIRNISPSSSGGTTLQTRPYNIAVDSTGASYMAASTNFGNSSSNQSRNFIVKLDTNGSTVFTRQIAVTTISGGSSLGSGTSLVSPSSTGMITALVNPSASYGGYLNLPADGTKTGAYNYASADRRFTYGSTNVNTGTYSPSASAMSLSTYSTSMGTGSVSPTTGTFNKPLNPISI